LLSFNSIQYCRRPAVEPENNYELINSPKRKSDIELKFSDFVASREGSLIELTVTNTTDQTIKYRSGFFPSNTTKQAIKYRSPIIPRYAIKIDGIETEESDCENFLSSYPIKPGETNIFRIKLREVSAFWQRGKSLQIGIGFSKESDKEYQTIWSPNLPISSQIENEILKDQRERKKAED
jgi:hypothetical protein